ncbi:unknown [Bacillus thuringiensis phage MZTP02]|uniref:Uncharacterized protein n=1 Tax=Bacillus thuringiensis phage MZTP02 TaxID=311221 RepID=Q56AR9_9CAUD|nr:unknown [Bacillus thuringiensis phage MZTP02]
MRPSQRQFLPRLPPSRLLHLPRLNKSLLRYPQRQPLSRSLPPNPRHKPPPRCPARPCPHCR